MSKAPTDPLAALSQRQLSALAAKLVREGRMPPPGQLADALAARPAKLSRDSTPTAAPYHCVFVSSSQRENSTVNQAKAGLHSPDFHNLVMLSHRLPGTEGGDSGLVYWSDGAEESRVIHVNDPNMLDQIAARAGNAFNQKAVLHFRSDGSGSDIAHVVTVPSTNPDEIADKLNAHGIEYKTVVPHPDEGKSEVHVIDLGGGLAPSVAGFAAEMGGTHQQHIGHATLIGAETREGAKALYDKILSESPKTGRTV